MPHFYIIKRIEYASSPSASVRLAGVGVSSLDPQLAPTFDDWCKLPPKRNILLTILLLDRDDFETERVLVEGESCSICLAHVQADMRCAKRDLHRVLYRTIVSRVGRSRPHREVLQTYGTAASAFALVLTACNFSAPKLMSRGHAGHLSLPHPCSGKRSSLPSPCQPSRTTSSLGGRTSWPECILQFALCGLLLRTRLVSRSRRGKGLKQRKAPLAAMHNLSDMLHAQYFIW